MSVPHKVLVACDTFKGTCPSYKVGEAFEHGLRRYLRHRGTSPSSVQVVNAPMSDGGAGLLDSITFPTPQRENGSLLHFERITVPPSVPILGPLGVPLGNPRPTFAWEPRQHMILIEMATASGLPLLKDPSQFNINETTSHGTGQLIEYAVQYARKQNKEKGIVLLLGIGGSATNDGGLGALQALGLEIYVTDETNKTEVLLTTPFKGKDLSRLTRVAIGEKMKQFFFQTSPFIQRVYLICDVDNPLVGRNGATFIFGPQKCSPSMKYKDQKTQSDLNEKVGSIPSPQFYSFLEKTDAAMAKTATNVVKSTFSFLQAHHYQQQSEQAMTERLLHGRQGGGAGGMSGFFHYLLNSRYLPGAEAVSTLQNIQYNADFKKEMQSLASVDPHTTRQQKEEEGYLATHASLLVTGEGSYDSQTLLSRKTIGKLLVMSVMENKKQNKRAVEEVLILCGKCGFESSQAAMKETELFLESVLLEENNNNKKENVKAFIPRISVLPLGERFTHEECMTHTFDCIVKMIHDYYEAKNKNGKQRSNV
ncbi:glycerate kinase [Angomonas deanei]|uniref:Glycerate kinase family, putative n=1 Tax=Angomonas deanei TaxID=59799 RepID=A0A7G2C0S4_9TRYP|nr:glycerate kinase [Angomonas deanei]CAD2212781.1 Glycerate kinase family, putative [Angomonas deanei]|eukprot:EPY38977.1 glycerate kinase [Angomonas deanei]